MRDPRHPFPCRYCQSLGVPCTPESCPIAGPGRAGECRPCWLAHGGEAGIRADGSARRTPAQVPGTRPPCRHLGPPSAATGHGTCAAGHRSARIPLYSCAVHRVCTPETPTREAHHRCASCDDYQPPAPPPGPPPPRSGQGHAGWVRYFDHATLHPGLPGKRFNGSLIAWQAGYLLAWRSGWEGSEVYLTRLDRHFDPLGQAVKLDLPHGNANFGREDPRLFLYAGKLHVGFTGVEGANGWVQRTSQLYARLDDGLRVERVYAPHYPGRAAWEKNWVFFEHAGDLLAVYSSAPQRILRVDGDRTELLHETATPATWRGGEIRGGAAPVRVGDEWWHFFHDSVPGHGVPRIYRAGLLAFEAAPPFAVTRMTAAPLLVSDLADQPADQYTPVIFPGGAVRAGAEWVLACGIHDRWLGLFRFAHHDLEARLVPLRDGRSGREATPGSAPLPGLPSAGESPAAAG